MKRAAILLACYFMYTNVPSHFNTADVIIWGQTTTKLPMNYWKELMGIEMKAVFQQPPTRVVLVQVTLITAFPTSSSGGPRVNQSG